MVIMGGAGCGSQPWLHTAVRLCTLMPGSAPEILLGSVWPVAAAVAVVVAVGELQHLPGDSAPELRPSR